MPGTMRARTPAGSTEAGRGSMPDSSHEKGRPGNCPAGPRSALRPPRVPERAIVVVGARSVSAAQRTGDSPASAARCRRTCRPAGLGDAMRLDRRQGPARPRRRPRAARSRRCRRSPSRGRRRGRGRCARHAPAHRPIGRARHSGRTPARKAPTARKIMYRRDFDGSCWRTWAAPVEASHAEGTPRWAGCCRPDGAFVWQSAAADFGLIQLSG